MRYVSANPATELVLPCYEKRLAERIVGEGDVRRLVETDAKTARSGPVTTALCRWIAGFGGMRLLWRNVRPRGDTGQITVFGKNGRTRSIALTAPLWSKLTALWGNASIEAPVFPSRSGRWTAAESA
jgi:hypothetical protein